MTTSPEKLLYPLEHAYTPAELAFETLKGLMPLQPPYSLRRPQQPTATSTWRWSRSRKVAVLKTSVHTVRAAAGDG